MADIADRAAEVIEQNEARQAQHRRATAPTSTYTHSECVECGLQIDSGRQIAQPGCTMCTDCADWWERCAARR